MKKIIAIVLCLIMVLALPLSSFAAPADERIYYAGPETSPKESVNLNLVTTKDFDTVTESDGEMVYYAKNRINPEDIIKLESKDVSAMSRQVGMRLEFNGAIPWSVYSDFNEHVIMRGSSASLSVSNCTWAPEWNDLEIGIYNWTTAENWYVIKSESPVSFSHVFSNLSAGSYSVYVRNRGSQALSTGYLLYNLY